MRKIHLTIYYDDMVDQSIKTCLRSVGEDGSVLDNACFTQGKLEPGIGKDIGQAIDALLFWEEHKRGKS